MTTAADAVRRHAGRAAACPNRRKRPEKWRAGATHRTRRLPSKRGSSRIPRRCLTSPSELYEAGFRAVGFRFRRSHLLPSGLAVPVRRSGADQLRQQVDGLQRMGRPRRRRNSMTMKLSRERALTAALDHLHTEATELARFAQRLDSSAADRGLPLRLHASAAGLNRRRTSVAPLAPHHRRRSAPSCSPVSAASPSPASAGDRRRPTTLRPTRLSPSAPPHARRRVRDSRCTRGVVGIAGDPSGHGYWLVAADGGVFAFGDAGVLRLDGQRPA